jgi:sulfoxide reductase heme-binding subunit YedZ
VIVGPSTYWLLTRATGAVALILLTLSVAVGVAAIGRVRTDRWPRFAVDAIHRTVSLLALVFLVVHIATSVLDSFAPIRLVDAVVPFAGTYRPLWLGLGAVGFDLLLAVIVTSVVRARLGYRAWRAVHWLGYLAWPVALLHGLGTGSDVRLGWMLVVNVACTAVVLVAVVARALIGWPEHQRVRMGALGAVLAFALGLVAWVPAGPLGSHWARRAGTPAPLLAPHSVSHGSSG